MNISPARTSTITGGLSADGNTLVSSQMAAAGFGTPDVLVGIKHGQANFTNASLKGTFTAVRYDWGGSLGDGGDLWSVTFDGAGNFSGTLVVNGGGNVGSGAGQFLERQPQGHLRSGHL